MLGNLIDILIWNDLIGMGNHSLKWTPGSNVSTGEYIISLNANNIQLATQKVAYIK